MIFGKFGYIIPNNELACRESVMSPDYALVPYAMEKVYG